MQITSSNAAFSPVVQSMHCVLEF